MSRVGAEILCYCGRCKLTLAHTVLALVGTEVAQVQCNTCRNIHANQRRPRRNASDSDTPKAAPRRRRSKAAVPDGAVYDAKLSQLAGKRARDYAVAERFQKDDILDHPSFGRGIVINVIFPDRIEVLFPTVMKTLIHGQ